MSGKKASSVLTETVLLASGSIPEQRLNVGLVVPVHVSCPESSQQSAQQFRSYLIFANILGLHSQILQRLTIGGAGICIWTCAGFCWLMIGTYFVRSGLPYCRHQRPESFPNRTRSLLNIESCVKFNVFFRCFFVHRMFILSSVTLCCVLH